MDKGTKFTFPASFYPRYRHLKQRLAELVPRLCRITEAGSLPDATLNGRELLKEIVQSAEHFRSSVTLYVFDEPKGLKKPDLFVQNHVSYGDDKEDHKRTTWSEFQSSTGNASMYECTICVCVVTSAKNFLEFLKSTTMLLTNVQKGNIVIYSTQDCKCYRYYDISDQEDPIIEPSTQSLSALIQTLLETKIMAMFEQIAAFINKFIPKEGEELEVPIMSAIDTSLQLAMKDENVIIDISPDRGMQETNDGNMKIPADLTALEKNQIFRRKIVAYFTNKIKCTLVENLAKKYGLSQAMVLDFFNEGFFGFDKKMKDLTSGMENMDWDTSRGISHGMFVCRMFMYDVIRGMSKLINEVEDYIQRKLEILGLMEKLQFELHGIMQVADVTVDTHIPDIPQLPTEVMCNIVRIPSVESCGHQYGRLVLRLNQQLTLMDRNDVDYFLKKAQYCHGYKTQLITKKVQVSADIDQGHELRSENERIVDNKKYNYFSLGCFVNIKPTDESKQEKEDLYALTCGHCVKNCKPNIHVKNGLDYREFGPCNYMLNENDFLDIAAVKVSNNVIRSCQKHLMRSSRMEAAQHWTFYSGNLARRVVYKHGSRTQLTHGIVVGQDNVTKDIAKCIEKLKNETTGSENALPVFQFLIEPKVDVPENSRVFHGGDRLPDLAPFSKDGDSGAVVCMEDPNSNKSVHVVGLLCGDYKMDDNTGSHICSYASGIHSIVQTFENKFNCKVIPACQSSS
ncbi:uncharacterized protein LOC128232402 [Mya arenaria]|uniref:uncharacterized protein LOC128232254 n=1 Tax=Mya arenaria TaxID=6604 RepID=UPI0022E5A3FB|nr:uncharacterized protein LOC128232254 [Mya arenaria]XP_052801665.1 uncharacterized protein LOC128232254 [Mya arenaria]XP_052801886.1 uncharacterized protein LOC128232402 [Mya arenaria]